jgi:hypothetical protein
MRDECYWRGGRRKEEGGRKDEAVTNSQLPTSNAQSSTVTIELAFGELGIGGWEF